MRAAPRPCRGGAPPRGDRGPAYRERRTAPFRVGAMSLVLAALLALAVATPRAGPAVDGLPLPLPRPPSEADYPAVDPSEAALGRLLFHDKVISGNRNISCATCHHPRFGTGDGLSLPLGEGGVGLGPGRRADPGNAPEQRVPRNAQPLFNLGAREFTVLFHDGRIEADAAHPSGLRTPLGPEMPDGFDSVLAAQTMFPVLSPDEMAGHYAENDVARAVRLGRLTAEGGAWEIIARRVASIGAYRDAFAALDPSIAAGRPIGFADVANAIAAFMAVEWRSDDSAFDAHLRGGAPLAGRAAQGMALFYGKAGCATCHSGPFQTDHSFHAMGAPQLGPGKAARFERHVRDEGRMEVTGRPQDAFRFRTPSLRNVAITGPWGHAGGHDDLAAFVRDHAAPRRAAPAWPRRAVLPPLAGADDFRIADDPAEVAAIVSAIAVADTPLSAREVTALVAFLESLTGRTALTGRLGIPATVPSGLPVED